MTIKMAHVTNFYTMAFQWHRISWQKSSLAKPCK